MHSYHQKMVYLLGGTLLLLVWLQQFTEIDLVIEHWYFDPITQNFPWKNRWFAKELMHGYVKNALMLLGIAIIIFCVVDYFRPSHKIHPLLRIRLRFVALAATVIPTSIAILKSQSASYCPWDVAAFGGHYPHLKLFETLPTLLKSGHCFPAGHASTGLWLTAFCVFWLPHAPRKAFFVFTLGLSVGFLLGWVQQMRGAHFLSHTLWSMWITSVILYSLLILFIPLLETKKPT